MRSTPGRKVVEHSTYNNKIKGSNYITDTGRQETNGKKVM